ncbi:MAG: LD-carboxypeptidase [Candidatus Pacebacteria bacterium]|nr:LD-carboxypeptidase [Candidatus Paceibacterota bacterium]
MVAPSRPIVNIKKDIDEGINILEGLGFKIKLGNNLYKKSYYSSGNAKERATDLNSMFADKNIKAVICATGGSSSNQILDLINYDLIKKNPKIFIGYSDITTLLLAINKKTGLVTFHGANLCDFKKITKKSLMFLFDMLTGKRKKYILPGKMQIIKRGKAKGTLIGGNIHLSNSLLGTKYSPIYNKKIWFWEEVGESPASLDQKLNQFKLSGSLKNISAMVIGNLSECIDKKYKEDNRPIDDIILELTKGYNFPIVKVPYFGHGVSNFYTFPIGIASEIDTETNEFIITESPVL